MEALQEVFRKLSGAVMIVYPMNLPSWDPVREIIEDTEDVMSTADAKEILDPATATLWFASKEIVRGKKLSDFIGRNEKTKVIAKLQKVACTHIVFTVLMKSCRRDKVRQ